MAWQCIAEGATGLVFYSWYDVKRNPDVSFDEQWSGLKRLAAEIDQMAETIRKLRSGWLAADGHRCEAWVGDAPDRRILALSLC